MPARAKIGANLYPQECSWEELCSAAEVADRAGCDSLWTWDHLYGVAGPEQSIFEAWTTLAAWACRTERATIGTLVCANTLRHPGLVAKSAVTVDHASRGRLVLGIGAGYQAREHAEHGIELGASREERIGWLAESLPLLRQLLVGEEATAPPRSRYRLHAALCRPGPFGGSGTIPFLIGGGSAGIVRLVARFADLWHTRGSVASLTRRLERLRAECEQAGRDADEIELGLGNAVVIRDDPGEAGAVYDAALRHNGQTGGSAPGEAWLGPPEAIAELWRPFAELGFHHLIADVPSPHDRETLERLTEVRALVSGSY